MGFPLRVFHPALSAPALTEGSFPTDTTHASSPVPHQLVCIKLLLLEPQYHSMLEQGILYLGTLNGACITNVLCWWAEVETQF